MHDESESVFIEHTPCSRCGSSDANALYSDGHEYCFSCGHHKAASKADAAQGEAAASTAGIYQMNSKSKPFQPVLGDIRGLKARGITEETCKFFGYQVGTYNNQPVQIANYRDKDREIVGQKLRFPGKDFIANGKISKTLFGQHLWSKGGRMLVITEGEIDCMTVSQIQGNKYPVVSVPTGASGAKRALMEQRDWVLSFEKIILMFDNDEPGRKAAQECAPLFPPGKCFVAELPLKDPNDMLKENRGKEVINAIWNAEAYKPSQIVTVDDIYEKALSLPEMGLSLPWDSATKATLGIRKGEIHIVGAAPKIGKTEHQHQLIKHMTDVHGETVGVMSLEENPVKTLKKVAGKYAGKQFTKPPEVGGYTMDELRSSLDLLRSKIEFYSSDGVRDADEILNTVRFWAAKGIWFFIIDPLTALVAEHDTSSANDILNAFMSKAASMAMELQITFFMYSHVNPVKSGKPHDQGGDVLSSQFTGSRAMEKWAHYGWGIQRDRTEKDPIKRNTARVTMLFDREFGEYCEYYAFYNNETNDWSECPPPDEGQQFTEVDTSDF